MYTKGEWKVFERLDGSIWICLNTPPIYPLIAHIDANFPEELVANAHLIVSAVNACQEINPDKPQAVAESIKDTYEALKYFYDHVLAFLANLEPETMIEPSSFFSPQDREKLNMVKQALAKAEEK